MDNSTWEIQSIHFPLPTSVLRSKSDLAPLIAASAPAKVMNPPTAAPLPSDPYKKRRRVLHGAIDSARSLLRTAGSIFVAFLDLGFSLSLPLPCAIFLTTKGGSECRVMVGDTKA